MQRSAQLRQSQALTRRRLRLRSEDATLLCGPLRWGMGVIATSSTECKSVLSGGLHP